MGDCAHDLCVLFEKGSSEVWFAAVVEWIPFVAEPAGVAVDGVVGFLGKDGDHFFVAHVAGAFVEGAFVSVGELTLMTAGWTVGGVGDAELFVELLVFWGDLEWLGAVFAGGGWHCEFGEFNLLLLYSIFRNI